MTTQDELDVRNLLARLAHTADTGQLEAYVACYTPDALWDMPGAPRRGRDGIRAGGQGGPGRPTRHFVTTAAVEVDGDNARSTSYWQYFVDKGNGPQLTLIGQYDDEFARTDEGWLLHVRRITIGCAQPSSEATG